MLFMQVVGYFVVSNYEADLKYIQEKQNITKERAQSVVDKLKEEVIRYANHESETIKSLKPDNAQLVLVVYPQLKANEVIQSLIEISRLNDSFYNLKLREQDIKSTLYFYQETSIFLTKPSVKLN